MHSHSVCVALSLSITKHNLANVGTTPAGDSLRAWAFKVSLRCVGHQAWVNEREH